MRRKLLGVLLSLSMALSLLPAGALAAGGDFPDMPAEGYWSYEALTAAVENGLLRGENGLLLPQGDLTRAQLAAILGRAFGAEGTADISGYSDVSASAWYYADIAKAVRMGTLRGSGGAMRPDESVTRQEAFTVLARAIKLADADTAALAQFSDGGEVAAWAAPALAAMVRAGYVGGDNGKLSPAAKITRAEFAQVIHKMIARYISAPGTYTESAAGNVLVNSGGVTLRNLTVTGDLILGEGVGNGDVTLDKVTVTGRLVVRGGGENSIRIINTSSVGSIIVGKTGDGGVRIRTEEGCRVDVVYVDDGLDDIILEGDFNQVSVNTDAPVVLRDATVTGLTVNGEGAKVSLAGTTAVSVTQITQKAAGATLEVGTGAKVARVESAAEGVTISGGGTVTQAVISGSNTAVNTAGTQVTAEAGATGVTHNGKPVGSGGASGGGGGGSPAYTAKAATLAALQAALSDSSATAISITGGITIPEGTSLTFNKPVTVAALPGAQLVISGFLTNDSTFTSADRGALDGGDDTGIIMDGSFINNGAFFNESRFGIYRGSFVNNGTVTNAGWFHSAGTVFENNGTFTSSGDLTLRNSDAFAGTDNVGATFLNRSGAAFTNSGRVQVFLSCAFTNDGAVMSAGSFENCGTLANNGSFTYAGYLLNAGALAGTAPLTPEGDKAYFENDLPVATLQALQDALIALDPAVYDGVAIVGEITLTGDLELTEYVLLTPDGTFIVPPGITLTVSSALGYNELKVSGKLEISGTLETTRSGEGDDETVGQVTIAGGALRAYGEYAIVNNGEILFIRGEIGPDDIKITGNKINYYVNVAGVTTEEALRKAMDDDDVDWIMVDADIALTSDLDITKYTQVNSGGEPYTLTIGAAARVAVKAGAKLIVYGKVVNNGAFATEDTSDGMFIGTYGSFVNNGAFDNNRGVDILESILENGGTFTNMNGGWLNMMGATLKNGAAATFTNEGWINLQTSAKNDEAVLKQDSTFENAGTFNNGAVSLPASDAFLGVYGGSLTNTGRFVNNGRLNLEDAALVHSAGTFDTYNSGGVEMWGGSLAVGSPFHNEGYMKIADVYGRDGRDSICAVSIDAGMLENDSGWLEYTAAVYSADGMSDAEAAQQDNLDDAETGDGYFDVYTRMDILADIDIEDDKTLSAFGTYWVLSTWAWDEALERDVETKVTLTVAENKTLTIASGSALNISGGCLVNNGALVTEAGSGEGDDYKGKGAVDIWPEGTFTNSGTVTNNGEFLVRYEDDGGGNFSRTGGISGGLPANTEYVAVIHSTAGLYNAVASDDPVYGRLEIKNDANPALTDSLTIDANVYIEAGSGLIVPYRLSLTFTGDHWINQCGDLTVWGDMTIGGGAWFFNQQKLEIGAELSAETAAVTVAAGGHLVNSKTIKIYDSGTLDAGAGHYQGNAPDMQGGTYIAPAG